MVSVATYLGDNTVDALDAIASEVTRQTGIELAFDHEALRSSSAARESASGVDLVWMCGGLFAAMDAAGELGHDVVAAPVFEGETLAVYRSIVIAHPDGPQSIEEALGSTLVINEIASWSGHIALRRHVAPKWFASEITSGAHASSIDMVASGDADCAAIDSTVWRHSLRQPDSPALGLNVIDQTADWPAPPFLLRRGLESETREKLVNALLSLGRVPAVASITAADSVSYEMMRPSG